MNAFILLFLFAVGTAAQVPCNLTMKDAPKLRDGLKLGMNIGTVSKAFPLEPDEKRSSDFLKIGKIDFDDVTFDLYFHNDQLSFIYATYWLEHFNTPEQFASVIATRFKIPGRMRPTYDETIKHNGLAIACHDFSVAVHAPNRLVLANIRLIRSLEKQAAAREAAETKRKARRFKP